MVCVATCEVPLDTGVEGARVDGLEGLRAPGHTQASWRFLQARRPQAGRTCAFGHCGGKWP